MGSNLFSKAKDENGGPWLASESRLSTLHDRMFIERTINHLKDNGSPLTLVDDESGLSQESLLVNIRDNNLQVDRPLEWVDDKEFFRIFFRDSHENWYFFKADRVSYSPFVISVTMPAEIHYLQRRACQRVKVPVGTRALVKNGTQAMTTVFVKDLSASGMLMSNDPADGEYATDSVINDILISIPPGGAGGENGNIRTVLPLIGQGRIVRSYVDRQTNRPCYGVSFQYDSNYVKDTINQIVSEVNRGVEQGDFI